MSETATTTAFEPGAVVLIPFRFTDRSGTKQRPAVVLSVSDYQTSRTDTVFMGLSSREGPTYFGDVRIERWEEAGLLHPTVAMGVIQTVETTRIKRSIGVLSREDFEHVRQATRRILGL